MKSLKMRHSRKTGISLVAVACFSTSAMAAGLPPSFDCAKAATVTEKAICASAELSDLDGRLGQAFSDVIAATPPDQLNKTRADEAAWIRSRDAACKGDEGCLGLFLRQRLIILKAARENAGTSSPATPTLTRQRSDAHEEAARPQVLPSVAPAKPAPKAALLDKVWYWNERYYCPGDPHYGKGEADPAYNIGKGEYVSESEARAASVARNGVSVPCAAKLQPLVTCTDGSHLYYIFHENGGHGVVETATDIDGYNATGTSGAEQKDWAATALQLAADICGRDAPRTFHGPVADWDASFKEIFYAQKKAYDEDRIVRLKKARQSSDCVSIKSRWDGLVEIEKTRELTMPEIRKKADLSAAAEMFNCGKLDEPWD